LAGLTAGRPVAVPKVGRIVAKAALCKRCRRVMVK
jgi:hypothetical protein